MPQCVRLFSWNNKSQCNNRITIMIYYFKQKRAHTHCYCCCLRSFFFANCNKSFNHPQGFAFARKQQQIMQTNQQTTGKCFLEINWMRVQWFIVQLTRKSLWTNFNWVFFSVRILIKLEVKKEVDWMCVWVFQCAYEFAPKWLPSSSLSSLFFRTTFSERILFAFIADKNSSEQLDL